MRVQIGHLWSSVWAGFAGKAVRIGLFHQVVVDPRFDLKFVERAFAQSGQEDLPDTLARMVAHGMDPTVPPVEVADDAHTLRVGRPHSEGHARYPVNLFEVRAELLIRPVVSAF